MVEKIKQHLAKHEKIYILIIIILAISCRALTTSDLASNDELWNFSNIYKMTCGFTIYKDINVIITPLFFWIGTLLFKILGTNYLIFRIYNIFIFSIMFFLIYLILKKLDIKRNKRIMYLGLIFYFYNRLIFGGANYNILAMFFYLLGIFLLLCGKNNKCIQGIIMFLIFMSKQNMGIYYCIGYFLYQLAENKSLIKAIKEVIISYLTFGGLVLTFLLFLLAKNNLYNFINYAFLGIKEFGIKNLKCDFAVYIYIPLIVIIFLFMIYVCHSKKIDLSKEKIKNARILTYMSLTALLSAFPLLNEYHGKLSILPAIISFIFILEKSFLEEITKNKLINKLINIANSVVAVGIIGFSILNIINYSIKINKNVNSYMYFGTVITNETDENIRNILQYIQESEANNKKVIILSHKANLYMNILKRNNGKMDLPFYGNLGKEGEDGLIEEIRNLKNTNLLILKDEENYIQESEKIRDYIKNNYEQIGEIEDFYIYKVGY